ncbi:hypothetical protein IMCC21224_112686 [Puniceibacterium sp. IMCC21224]|nr:hypothetical protein IMCC21224_112686 [Puniceibacterium sp. IMCC21224]
MDQVAEYPDGPNLAALLCASLITGAIFASIGVFNGSGFISVYFLYCIGGVIGLFVPTVVFFMPKFKKRCPA